MKTKTIEMLAAEAFPLKKNPTAIERITNDFDRKKFIAGALAVQRWIPINEEKPAIGIPVDLFNPEWIDEDFNPEGIREGCKTDMADQPWVSCVWNSSFDEYVTDEISSPTHWRPREYKLNDN